MSLRCFVATQQNRPCWNSLWAAAIWWSAAAGGNLAAAEADQPPLAVRTRIVLAGDSTVTKESGWGMGFAACAADDVQVINLARGGRSSSSFREEGLWDQVLAEKPDWVLIQFGHNDEPGHPGKENKPDVGYRAQLERYVEEARAAGARVVLITPLCRRQWGKTPRTRARIVSSLDPYADVVRQVAEEKEVALIDLHFRSQEVYQSLGPEGCTLISPVKPTGQLDGTHLNEAGAVMFGSMVAMDCRSYVPGLTNCFPTSKLMELQQTHRPPSLERGGRTHDRHREAAGPPRAQGPVDVTVARDGSGDYLTVQEAIDAVPANNADRAAIRIKPGVYMGQIVVPASKPNVTLLGDDRAQSILSYALTVHDPIPPGVSRGLAGYGVVVLGDGFQAANLTIRQVAGDHGQAIALRIDGDRAVLQGCSLVGWQDTVRLERGRHYLRDCFIEGRVDYIYGGAAALLENCTAHTKGNGYVTAASTPREQPWGYAFVNCRLTGTKPQSVLFGRPWRPYARVALVNCEMDDSINPVGWDNWRNPENEQTARYAEYGSTGPGADMSRRVEWARTLTDAEASEISAQTVLGGDDGWDAVAEADRLRAAVAAGK